MAAVEPLQKGIEGGQGRGALDQPGERQRPPFGAALGALQADPGRWQAELFGTQGLRLLCIEGQLAQADLLQFAAQPEFRQAQVGARA